MRTKDWIIFTLMLVGMIVSFYLAFEVHLLLGIPGAIIGIMFNSSGGGDPNEWLGDDY